MNRSKFEISILIVFIGLVIFIWFFSDDLLDFKTERACERLKNREIKSIVKEARKDYSNKGQFTITVDYQGEEIRTSSFFLNIDISKYLETGDSLYKPKGVFKYYIYKNNNPDSLIILENDINCKDFSNKGN